MLTTLERLFRRAQLPIAMSQGFHPKLRMSFFSALPLGVGGMDEVLELEFCESVDPRTVLTRLNECTVDGLTFLHAHVPAPHEKKVTLRSSRYELTVPTELRAQTAQNVERLLNAVEFPIEKHNGKIVNLRPVVAGLDFDRNSGHFHVELFSTSGPDAGIRELLVGLDLGNELFKTLFPVRTECLLG